MKLLLIKLMLVVGMSSLFCYCTTSKLCKRECIGIYRTTEGCNLMQQYILLKAPDKSYEIFNPIPDSSIIGVWEVRNDTLFLKPSVHCFMIGDSMHIVQPDTIPTVISITRKYKIKKNCLIDITNYAVTIPEWPEKEHIPYTKYFLWK